MLRITRLLVEYLIFHKSKYTNYLQVSNGYTKLYVSQQHTLSTTWLLFAISCIQYQSIFFPHFLSRCLEICLSLYTCQTWFIWFCKTKRLFEVIYKKIYIFYSLIESCFSSHFAKYVFVKRNHHDKCIDIFYYGKILVSLKTFAAKLKCK